MLPPLLAALLLVQQTAIHVGLLPMGTLLHVAPHVALPVLFRAVLEGLQFFAVQA